MRIEVGMKIDDLPLSLGEDIPSKRLCYPGTVIYVHPQRRWFEAELELPGGQRVKECYYIKRLVPGSAKPEDKDRGKYRKDI